MVGSLKSILGNVGIKYRVYKYRVFHNSLENVNYNKSLLFIHLLMHIPKCQGIFNRTVFNLLFDIIYFLFNKVLET